MLTSLKWFYLLAILLVAFAGGYAPLARPERARSTGGLRYGEAFTAGVFLALSLTMLLPSAFHVFRTTLPDVDYPIASVIAIVAFLLLLAIEHATGHVIAHESRELQAEHLPKIVPVIMTIMIAIPSFFLGATMGISESAAATLIFIAIILHKGTAGFALALAMVRSSLRQPQIWLLFALFASSTPLGILVGGAVQRYVVGEAVVVKGIALALGAGVFLYLATIHDMKHASMIEQCCTRGGFLAMLAGLAITALVRLIVGEAHRL